MDEYVKDILRKWELPELIPTFEEEEVNEKAFKCLTDDIIRELVPKLGKRAIFNKTYRAYREALDKQPDSSVVVKPNESVSLPDDECTSVVVIKLETAIGDLPENDTSTIESQVSLEDTFKLEPQIPEEVVAEEVQGSEHQQLEAASASSVDNECIDTSNTAHGSLGNSGVEQSSMETETIEELSGSVSKTSVITHNIETFQDKTVIENAVTETTTEHSVDADILIDTKESDHEGLDNVMETLVDVDSSDNVQTVGETFVVEPSMSNVQQHERASTGSPITEITESQYAEELEYHESDNQIVEPVIDEPSSAQEQEDCRSASPEYPLLDQCIDGSQTSHITFSISELSDPAEEDLKSAECLRQLLSTSTSLGHLLGKPFLTRSTRNALAEEIVDHLCTSADGVLSNELLRSWARAVELVFAQEVNQLYFRESEDGYSCGGKLVQCYQRRKQSGADTVNRETG